MKFKIYLILLLLFSCSSNSEINQEGYFKDNNNNRIKTFSYKKNLSEDDIKTHAYKQMNTAGSITSAYYFLESSPIPRSGLSSAKNIFVANEVINLFSKNIKYAYIRNNNGISTFVNCTKEPKNDLCVEH